MYPKMVTYSFDICLAQAVDIDPAYPVILFEPKDFFYIVKLFFFERFIVVIENRNRHLLGFLSLWNSGWIDNQNFFGPLRPE